MSGGLIQLVARGVQNIFLTEDPQITFFKVVYRRHTNFSIEEISQRFNKEPNFGEKVSATISRSGDMCSRIFVVIELPSIPKLSGNINNFKWVDFIGYSIINNVEIEIGGRLMDRHYGEWLYIWNELTGLKDDSFDEMIGNKSELTNLDKSKNSFTLYVPLEFWFCRNYGLSLPLVNLQYSEVRINLELNNSDKTFVGSPTHYIQLEDDLVRYKKGEVIKQELNNGITNYGEFVYFNNSNKKLYYNKLSNNNFKSITSDNSSISQEEIDNLVRDSSNSEFKIIGETTKFKSMPKVNAKEKKHNFPKLRNFNIKDCYLLVTYMYLDEEEREKFALNKHEYLIEQIQFSGNKTLKSIGNKVNININNPTKEMVWIVQFANTRKKKDYYNYTDSPDKNNGVNIIKKQTININGNERVKFRNSEYFDTVHIYQNHKYSPSKGINIYSFCLHPTNHQPSGPINMSKIANLSITMQLVDSVGPNNTANLRSYAITNNILRVANGIAGTVFTSQI